MATNYFFKYLKPPSIKRWKQLEKQHPLLDNLALNSGIIENFQGLSLISANTSLRELNNRLGFARTAFVLSASLFAIGIPDDPPVRRGTNRGPTFTFLPLFEERHYYIKYFFDFYTQAFYSNSFGSWDLLHYFLNDLYLFEVRAAGDFNDQVKRKLLRRQPDLVAQLRSAESDQVFADAKRYRREMTHGIPPSAFTSGLSKQKRTYTLSAGDYVKSSEIWTNMCGLVSLWSASLREFEVLLAGRKP